MNDSIHYTMVIRLFTGDESRALGPGVAELLHRVEELHSLRSAAGSMGMAYSKAWSIIKNSENALGYSLLTSTTGGRHGGGAVLTAEGRELLENYDHFCAELQAYGNAAFSKIFGGTL